MPPLTRTGCFVAHRALSRRPVLAIVVVVCLLVPACETSARGDDEASSSRDGEIGPVELVLDREKCSNTGFVEVAGARWQLTEPAPTEWRSYESVVGTLSIDGSLADFTIDVERSSGPSNQQSLSVAGASLATIAVQLTTQPVPSGCVQW